MKNSSFVTVYQLRYIGYNPQAPISRVGFYTDIIIRHPKSRLFRWEKITTSHRLALKSNLAGTAWRID